MIALFHFFSLCSVRWEHQVGKLGSLHARVTPYNSLNGSYPYSKLALELRYGVRGAIMARIDFRHPEAVRRQLKVHI